MCCNEKVIKKQNELQIQLTFLDGRRQNNCTKELTRNKDEGEESLDDFLENGRY